MPVDLSENQDGSSLLDRIQSFKFMKIVIIPIDDLREHLLQVLSSKLAFSS